MSVISQCKPLCFCQLISSTIYLKILFLYFFYHFFIHLSHHAEPLKNNYPFFDRSRLASLTGILRIQMEVELYGHSFFSRLARDCHALGGKKLNLDLHEADFCITFNGCGGATLVDYKPDTIRSEAPELIVMEVGTNDLTAIDANHVTIGSAIDQMLHEFLEIESVKLIILVEVLKRQKQGVGRLDSRTAVEEFNQRAINMNSFLESYYSDHPKILFWRHNDNHRLTGPNINPLGVDGVHLSATKMRRYFNSIRSAVVAGDNF